MKWNNLKNLCCPKCGDSLTKTSSGYQCGEIVHDSGCATSFCDFKISIAKFDSIVNDLYNKKPRGNYAVEDNSSALNNFGHKEYSRDYSDEIERL